jgi:hypothetical protein
MAPEWLVIESVDVLRETPCAITGDEGLMDGGVVGSTPTVIVN